MWKYEGTCNFGFFPWSWIFGVQNKRLNCQISSRIVSISGQILKMAPISSRILKMAPISSLILNWPRYPAQPHFKVLCLDKIWAKGEKPEEVQSGGKENRTQEGDQTEEEVPNWRVVEEEPRLNGGTTSLPNYHQRDKIVTRNQLSESKFSNMTKEQKGLRLWLWRGLIQVATSYLKVVVISFMAIRYVVDVHSQDTRLPCSVLRLQRANYHREVFQTIHLHTAVRHQQRASLGQVFGGPDRKCRECQECLLHRIRTMLPYLTHQTWLIDHQHQMLLSKSGVYNLAGCSLSLIATQLDLPNWFSQPWISG